MWSGKGGGMVTACTELSPQPLNPTKQSEPKPTRPHQPQQPQNPPTRPPEHILEPHCPRIDVRQQPRLAQHGGRRRAYVLQRAAVAHGRQLGGCLRVEVLRLVACWKIHFWVWWMVGGRNCWIVSNMLMGERRLDQVGRTTRPLLNRPSP